MEILIKGAETSAMQTETKIQDFILVGITTGIIIPGKVKSVGIIMVMKILVLDETETIMEMEIREAAEMETIMAITI